MKLITELNANSSKSWKMQCLKGIEFLEWQTFVAAYNPYFMYGVKFKDYDMDNLGEPNTMMFSVLERLAAKELVGNKAKEAVERHAEVFGDLIKLVCNKDLRCGVTATTFNKVHRGSIPEFNVQLAKEVPLTNLKYPLLAQIKYDGVRLVIINNDGKVTFWTRNGKQVTLRKLQAALEAAPNINYMLDGEIVYAEGKQDGRTSISGAINSAMHGGIVDEQNMVVHIFDAMSRNDWEAAYCQHAYTYRFDRVHSLLHHWQIDSLRPAVTHEICSPEEAQLFYDVILEQGYEGLILKRADHKYTFKRSKDWVKVKEVKTADLKCIGWLEGDGKYEGKIGALTLEGEVEGQFIIVNVGSGLTDADRGLTVWNEGEWQMSYYMDKTIEVKYNSLIQDSKTEEWSLFLPRYVCVRIDK